MKRMKRMKRMTAVVPHFTYDSTLPPTHGYLWPPVLGHLSTLPAGSDVLDVGCGNGAFAMVLSERDFRVCGFDLEPSGVAEAVKLGPDGHFVVASVYNDLLA